MYCKYSHVETNQLSCIVPADYASWQRLIAVIGCVCGRYVRPHYPLKFVEMIDKMGSFPKNTGLSHMKMHEQRCDSAVETLLAWYEAEIVNENTN